MEKQTKEALAEAFNFLSDYRDDALAQGAALEDIDELCACIGKVQAALGSGGPMSSPLGAIRHLKEA